MVEKGIIANNLYIWITVIERIPISNGFMSKKSIRGLDACAGGNAFDS